MEARAAFGGAQFSAAVIRLLMVALLSAFLIGGVGGYLVRGFGSSIASPTTTTTTSTSACPAGSHAVVQYTAGTWTCAVDTRVIEQAPYSTPRISPAPEPMHDPSGRVISI
jgi:hypothetical protein